MNIEASGGRGSPVSRCYKGRYTLTASPEIRIKGREILMARIKPKKIIEKVLISPIFISFMVFLLATFVVYILTVSNVESAYNKEFVRDVLVEAHGMLFDILIIGTFIFTLHTLVEGRREKKRNIRKWQEEIDDIKYWKSREAMYSIVGNIKRLEKNGVTKIDLRYCFLEHAPLRGIKLQGAILRLAKLQNANLWQANLQGANLWKAELMGANLREANLQSAILKYAELKGAILEGANLQGANLHGALGVSENQLAKVKTLHNTQLENYLMNIMRKNHPQLFEKPEESNN